jgi:maltooligosyltrehalose trehalohydrolase
MSVEVRDVAQRCGAIMNSDGTVTWRVWAPHASAVELVLLDGASTARVPGRRCAMVAEEGGYFRHTEAGIEEGRRYAFRLDGGPERPDPCSLWQPDGVHTPSAVYAPGRFAWTDQTWRGVRREDLVFYELHVGAFTPEGTFEAVITRLPELRELGVTALELMPVAQFPGRRNWGYDGVHPFVVQNSYGGPHGFQRLVDACHAEGLACFLDVVYNHLGPEGNYLAEFGPYFTDRYQTPWGRAVNYDGRGCDGVRDFVLDNVRMWLEEFHLDGLRLDAVHAVFDLGARHLLRAVKETVEAVSARVDHVLHVVAESDLNDPRLLLPADRGGHGLDIQWADDFHHALHTWLTGERQGYYEDYGRSDQLARVVGEPFLYAGDHSPFRGRRHGAAAPPELAGDRFVVCTQNHDQIGNRAQGDRLSTLLGTPAELRLAASLLLLSPYVPLLFMGEEYGETNPFPFFCSFEDPGLVRGVREGRRREFKDFTWQGEVPDPQAEETFASARLSWSWLEGTQPAGLRRLYADLLAARREWPALHDFSRREGRLIPEGTTSVLELIRGGSESGTMVALFNLSGHIQPLPGLPGRPLFTSESSRYLGARREGEAVGALLPHECAVYGPGGWKRFE